MRQDGLRWLQGRLGLSLYAQEVSVSNGGLMPLMSPFER